MASLQDLSDDDLLALKAGDLSKVSDSGLLTLKAMRGAAEGPQRSPQDNNPQLGYASRADEAEAAKRSAAAKDSALFAAAPAAVAIGGAPVAGTAAVAMLADLVKQTLAGRGSGSKEPVQVGEAFQQGIVNAAPVAKGVGAMNAIKNAAMQGAAGLAGSEARSIIDDGKLAGAGEAASGASLPAAGALVAPILGKTIAAAAGNRAPISTGNASKDAMLTRLRGAGFTIPESDNYLDKVLRGWAGKDAVKQQASIMNNEVADAIARKANGMGAADDLSNAAIANVRRGAVASGYDPVRSAGEILTDKKFTDSLDEIAGAKNRALPGLGRPDIADAIKPLRVEKMDAGTAVDSIAALRQRAKQAASGASPDYALASANRSAANALEDQLERSLEAKGEPGKAMLDSYRKARQDIARASSTEDAIRVGGHSIIPAELGKALQNKEPLSGGLEAIGEMANNFSRYSQEASRIPTPGVSKIQAGLAGTMGLGTGLQTGNPIAGLAAAAAAYSPDAIRAMVLSKPYQNFITKTAKTDPEQVATIVRTLRALAAAQQNKENR
jgi:hypothetical protein